MYAPEGGSLLCPSPRDGEGNWDSVRVIEVEDPRLRRTETGFYVPVVSAFLLILTGIGDTRVAAAQTRAASRRCGPAGAPQG